MASGFWSFYFHLAFGRSSTPAASENIRWSATGSVGLTGLDMFFHYFAQFCAVGWFEPLCFVWLFSRSKISTVSPRGRKGEKQSWAG